MENNNSENDILSNDLANLDDDQLLLFTKLFSQFDKTSLKLRGQFHQLQSKVDELLLELDEKNKYLEEVYQKQQETNNLLFTLLKNLTSAVVLFDINFNCILANNQASFLFEIDEEEFSDLNYNDILNFKYEDSELLKNEQLRGKFKFNVERILITRSQKEVPVYIKATILEDEVSGEVSSYLYVIDDLSELRKMENEVRKNKSFVEIGQMSASIAHEIRNPLGGISGFATMLSRDLKDDPDKLELVDKIRDGVKSLNRITTDVLIFNRTITTSYSKLDPQKVISGCIDLIKSELEIALKSNITISSTFPNTILEADIDKGHLKQIIVNILRNAFQAITGEGNILVSLKYDLFKNIFFISIKDDGCGIKEEDQNLLFTPFFTTKAEGTGLGLAVTKKMIESMNGEIEIISKIDQGSEFIIKLPIRNT